MKFEELNLKPELHKAVHRLGFTEATEIQAKTIPVILSGKDMVGQSKTGSGKTAAFGLPIINSIESGNGVQAIILTPTRELCVQVHDIMRQLGQFMKVRIASVYGGVGIGPQIDELKRAEIVVGTPGRVMDHLERRTLDLSKTKYFVLDEADRMLEMGFIDDIKSILRSVPKERQSLMFSATMPAPIKTIVNHNFKNPVYITGQTQVDNNLLKQIYYNLNPNEKFAVLVHLIREKQGVTLIFCATRHEVDLVAENLKAQGIKAVSIHGGLTQNKRLHVVDMIKKEQVKVLVATDVAARGLDIRNITHVFNYDLPKTPEEYTHRIGRTARAGDEGEAITLLTHADYDNFSKILANRSIKIVRVETPKYTPIKFERMQQKRHNFNSREAPKFNRFSGRNNSASDNRSQSMGESRFGKRDGARGRNETVADRDARRRRRERR
ncbi:MAG: DEAD/DEAH box helicase [Candidatus Woesearchaeota archaeon]